MVEKSDVMQFHAAGILPQPGNTGRFSSSNECNEGTKCKYLYETETFTSNNIFI